MQNIIIRIAALTLVIILSSCKGDKSATPNSEAATSASNEVVETKPIKSSNPYVGVWAGKDGTPLVEVTKPSKTEFTVRTCDGKNAKSGITYPAIYGDGAIHANVSHRDFHKHIRPSYTLKDGPTLLYGDAYGEATLSPSNLSLPDVTYNKPVNPDGE